MTKRKVGLKLQAYHVVAGAVESAIPYGIRRYYKYRDEPELKEIDAMVEEVYEAVMLNLCEVIDFDD